MEKRKPRTWLGIGQLSGLNIMNCRVLEGAYTRRQINIVYRVATMCFPDPIDPLRFEMFRDKEFSPTSFRNTVTSFEEQTVEIIVSTRSFPYVMTEEWEKMVARTIFQVWSIQSGHAQWEDNNRREEHERHYR